MVHTSHFSMHINYNLLVPSSTYIVPSMYVHVYLAIQDAYSYSRLRLIYPRIIETVKDWADCGTPIEVGLVKI